MAYQKGEIEYNNTVDTRDDYENRMCIYLPHSCNEWVIGGKAQALQLIEDLQKLIEEHFEG